MYDLSKKYYGSRSKILEVNSSEQEVAIFNEILSSKLVLVSYDCDFNFEPCNKNGIKAHWALVTGFFLPVKKNELDSVSINENKSTMINLNNKSNDELFLSLKNKLSFQDEAYVICKHGKSKHSGVWNLKRLIESNRQLKQIDELKCNEDDFVRPRDGNIGATLSSKVLIFN